MHIVCVAGGVKRSRLLFFKVVPVMQIAECNLFKFINYSYILQLLLFVLWYDWRQLPTYAQGIRRKQEALPSFQGQV